MQHNPFHVEDRAVYHARMKETAASNRMMILMAAVLICTLVGSTIAVYDFVSKGQNFGTLAAAALLVTSSETYLS